MTNDYLQNTIKQFEYYKLPGDKSFDQVSDEDLFWQYNESSNSIAVVVKHLWGNMLSRWTDFLTRDGEKDWRNRDAEFENNILTREELLQKWNEGWKCLFDALHGLHNDDLEKIIYIRNMGLTVTDAISRQLAHYTYHVGQIVYIARMKANEWKSLSIPKGQSRQYNEKQFAKPKHVEHYTDEIIENHSPTNLPKGEA